MVQGYKLIMLKSMHIAHQYSMIKEKYLVGGVVELKVVVSHANEAEVIIPEKHQHLQNS